MIEQIENYQFERWYYAIIYPAVAIAFSMIMRFVFAVMRAYAAPYGNMTNRIERDFASLHKWERIKLIWSGTNIQEPHPDLWYNSIIGTTELLIFPFLMRFDGLAIIGAWIGFKTVAQWSKWTKDNRLTFNRYLIGCAANVILSFMLMNWFIY